MLVTLVIFWIPSLRGSVPVWPLVIGLLLSPAILVLGCTLILISDVILRFVAQLAKADLEAAETKLSLIARLRANALSYSWKTIVMAAFCYSAGLLLSLLWLIRGEWSHVPFPLFFSFIRLDLLIFGVGGGALGLAILFWQARVKLHASA